MIIYKLIWLWNILLDVYFARSRKARTGHGTKYVFDQYLLSGFICTSQCAGQSKLCKTLVVLTYKELKVDWCWDTCTHGQTQDLGKEAWVLLGRAQEKLNRGPSMLKHILAPGLGIFQSWQVYNFTQWSLGHGARGLQAFQGSTQILETWKKSGTFFIIGKENCTIIMNLYN